MFGIKLQISSIYRFKESISLHYRQIYDDLARTILNSPVLYIDETTANLRSESGYVWCVMDGRSVYYFYKSSREGSFLADMFKNFTGVLVSDFYTAYDSLICRQQRCLVHLMRDFNEEMQRHPFDSELKLLATRFTAVLRSAVNTIDKVRIQEAEPCKAQRGSGTPFVAGLQTVNLTRRQPRDFGHELRNIKTSFLHSWTTMVFHGTTRMQNTSLNPSLGPVARRTEYLPHARLKTIWSFCPWRRRARAGERASLSFSYETMSRALALGP